jgi:hypothetical protein
MAIVFVAIDLAKSVFGHSWVSGLKYKVQLIFT